MNDNNKQTNSFNHAAKRYERLTNRTKQRDLEMCSKKKSKDEDEEK